MKILLDTHIIIWFLEDSKRLKSYYIDLIAEPSNVIYFSPVSIAEMAILASKIELKSPEDIVKICLDEGFEELVLSSKHSILLKDLPLIHHDPFDRLLLVQAKSENMYLLTEDCIFTFYDINLIKKFPK